MIFNDSLIFLMVYFLNLLIILNKILIPIGIYNAKNNITIIYSLFALIAFDISGTTKLVTSNPKRGSEIEVYIAIGFEIFFLCINLINEYNRPKPIKN